MKSQNKKRVKIIGILIACVIVVMIVFLCVITYLNNRLEELSKQPLGENIINYYIQVV